MAKTARKSSKRSPSETAPRYKSAPPLNMSQIIGHTGAISFLQGCISKQNLAHAYLFKGPSAVGKWTLARAFAQAVLRTQTPAHPDLILIDEEGALTIDTVRQLKHAVSLSPHSSAYKICLVNNAHRMTEEASNALLKTLEEPPDHSIFILITDRPADLLQTIISRVVSISFSLVSRQTLESGLLQSGISAQDINRLWRWFSGRPGMYLSWKQDSSIEDTYIEAHDFFVRLPAFKPVEKIDMAAKLAEHAQYQLILEHWIRELREMLLGSQGASASQPQPQPQPSPYSTQRISEMIQLINRMRRVLETPVNKKLAYEHLLFNL